LWWVRCRRYRFLSEHSCCHQCYIPIQSHSNDAVESVCLPICPALKQWCYSTVGVQLPGLPS
jgi:hypothetical protein